MSKAKKTPAKKPGARMKKEGDVKETSSPMPSRRRGGYPHGEKIEGTFVDEYVYYDQNRREYGKVEKWESVNNRGKRTKKYPQYKFKKGTPGSEASRWERGAPKYKIPYNLPNLIEADKNEPVFICEGEKDADTLRNEKLLATCTTGGASDGAWSNHAKDLNKWFKGRKTVYVLEDNDKDGRRHVRQVAKSLRGVVENIHIVKLPGLPEHGDVTDWFESGGGTREKFLAECEASPEAKERREIKVISGQIAQAVDDTQAALLGVGAPVLQRAGVLVEPIWAMMRTHRDLETKVTVFRELSPNNLPYMLNKHAATYLRFDERKQDWLETDPPQKVMMQLLNLGHWGFPHVTGIVHAPTLRRDGSILDEKGFDQATGLWFEPDGNVKLGPIPDKPTKADAVAALSKIETLLAEFPFVEKIDRSVALAAVLTAVLRGAFQVAPMFLFLAHTAGTGKSYLATLISHIVRGRPCPVITFSPVKEEMEKRLGAILLEGPPIISLDNCSTDLGGDLLCQMTEQPTIKVRVLGQSRMPECEWRGTLFATGNNVSLEGDMTRRGLICNLDAQMERPEQRRFKIDPIELVMKDRGIYITAAIVIARAYLAAKPKLDCSPVGSYAGWSKFVREPLIWLGQPDPLDSQEQARRDDPRKNANRSLIELWRQHLPKQALTVAEIIAYVAGDKFDGTPHLPEFYNLLIEQAGAYGKIDPRRLGMWLRSMRREVHEGWRVDVARADAKRGHRWIFERVGEAVSKAGG